MLPNNQGPVPQREALVRVVRNRDIKCGVSNRDTRRRCNHPPDVLVGAVPHFDPERQVSGNVAQVRIGEFAQQLIHTEIRVG
jgi:hypothetical protein